VLVGAPGHNVGKVADAGSVYVFQADSSGKWQQAGVLAAKDGTVGDRLGTTVAIARSYAAAGAPDDAADTGAVYVFERAIDGSWSQRARLVATDKAPGDRLGYSLDLDGTTLLTGALNDDGGADAGSAYVFERIGGGLWVASAKLVAAKAAKGERFGAAVAIEGDTALIGAPDRDVKGADSGAVMVFSRGSNNQWPQIAVFSAKLPATDAHFGGAIGLQGARAIVGATGDAQNGTSAGAAYIFARDKAGTWGQTGKLVAGNGAAHDNFGAAVAISGTGAAIGAIYHGGSGAAWAATASTFSCNAAGKCSCAAGFAGDKCDKPADPCAAIGGCDDGDTCTDDTCDKVKLACSHKPRKDGVSCDDGNKCTTKDTCKAGKCDAVPRTCDDGNECTISQCSPTTGCTFPAKADGALCAKGTGLCGDGKCTCAVGTRSTGGMCVDCGCHAVGAIGKSTGGELGVKLISAGLSKVADFGSRVAGSGDLLLVGANAHDGKFAGSGAALIYRRHPNGSRTRMALLQPPPTTTRGVRFGVSVALAGGDAVVGASWDDGGGKKYGGAAYLHRRDAAGVWQRLAKLENPASAAYDQVGTAVAIAGSEVLLGAELAPSGSSEGYVAAFSLGASGTPVYRGKFAAPDKVKHGRFGCALAAHGKRLLIGARRGNGKLKGTGTAYIYRLQDNGTWAHEAELFAGDGAYLDYFGNSVALHGTRALIGAPYDDDKGPLSGAAYVFAVDGSGAWKQVDKIVAAAGAKYDYAGTAVALYGDKALVGAPGDDGGGSVEIRDRDNTGAWQASGTVMWPGASSSASFGASVALAAGGGVIGAYRAHASHGAAYALVPEPTACDAKGQCTCKAGFTGLRCDQHKDPCAVAGFCDDGSVCTVDTCTAGKCKHAPGAAKFCTDGDACTVTDLCKAGACKPGSKRSCDDKSPCTIDSCDSMSGCVNKALEDGLKCDDGNACTVSTVCKSGACTGLARKCDDGNECTSNTCDTKAGCKYPAVKNGTGCRGGTGTCNTGLCTCKAGTFDSIGKCVACACDPAHSQPDAAPIAAVGPALALSSGAAEDRAGRSVARGGDYIFVGAPGDDDKAKDAGRVAVWRRSASGDFKHVQTLYHNFPQVDDGFGRDLALDDGRAAISAYRDAAFGYKGLGSVLIYEPDNTGTWRYKQRLFPSHRGDEDRFGSSVALSGDTVVAGAPLRNEKYTNAGAAFVFARSDKGHWSATARLVAADRGSYDNFGFDVALDGDRLLVSAPFDNTDDGVDTGSVYAYLRTGKGQWAPTAKLAHAKPAPYIRFGYAVALDGSRALIGVLRDTVTTSTQGSAAVFTVEAKETWKFEQLLVGSAPAAGAYFGIAVALRGNRAIVGSDWGTGAVARSGTAHTFARGKDGKWLENARLKVSGVAKYAYFGGAVDLDRTGAVVGAWKHGGKGAAWPVDVDTFSCDGAGQCQCDVGYGTSTCAALTTPCSVPGWCDDGNSCSLDACNKATGACSHTPLQDGAKCDDGSKCTEQDACGKAACVAKPKACDDGKDCTLNTCDPGVGCLFPPSPDGSVCGGGGGNCSAGKCACELGSYDVGGTCKACGCKALGSVGDASSGRLGSEVRPSSSGLWDWFGHGLASHGKLALVGAHKTDVKYSGSGSVFVFNRGDHGAVKQTTRLFPSDPGSHDWFGFSVATNGAIAAVGSPYEDAKGTNAGAVYLFRRLGVGKWAQTAKLHHPKSSAYLQFGERLAMDTNLLAIGSERDTPKGPQSGTVQVYRIYSSGAAKHVASLVAPDATSSDLFGRAVAVSGKRLIAGAPFGDGKKASTGNAWIFEQQPNGTFKAVAELFDEEGEFDDQFGFAADINGGRALVGAPQEGEDTDSSGAAFMFERAADGKWKTVAMLVAADIEVGDEFGASVALWGDKALVGAPGNTLTGSAYAFFRGKNAVWRQVRKLEWPGAQESGRFGESVALHANAGIVGARYGRKQYGAAFDFNGLAYGCDSQGACKCASGFSGKRCDQVASPCSIAGFCDDGNACTSDSCSGNKCQHKVLTSQSCDDGNVCTLSDRCVAGKCVAGGKRNCNDNQVCTVDSCNPTSGCVNARVANDTACGSGVCRYGKCACPRESRPTAEGSCAACACNEAGTYASRDKARFGERLLRTTPYENSQHGYSVGRSGGYAMVGAPAEHGAGAGSGVARVYFRGEGGDWWPRGTLAGSTASAGDRFGTAVAIDGSYAVVGAPSDDQKQANSGSAFVFKRGTDGKFKEVAALLASDPAKDDAFGSTVAIGGTTIAVGAPHEDSGGKTGNGAVYVFERQADGKFKEVVKLVAKVPGSADGFGRAVSVSGTTIAVGVPYDDDAAKDAGSVQVFEKVSGKWTHKATLLGAGGKAGDQLGRGVSVSGSWLIGGAPYNDTGAANAGRVYVFTRSTAGVWSQNWSTGASAVASGDYYGYSVALSGTRALIGAPGDNTSAGTNAGSVTVFYRSGTKWYRGDTLYGGKPGAETGFSVAQDGIGGLAGGPFAESSTGIAQGIDLDLFQCSSSGKCSCRSGFSGSTCGVASNPCGTSGFCDDGNSCTADSCKSALKTCLHKPLTNTACFDDDVCAGPDRCASGKCTAGKALDCDDKNPCTVDTCHPVLGCLHGALEDGDACGLGKCSTGKCVCPLGTRPGADGACIDCGCSTAGAYGQAQWQTTPPITAKDAAPDDNFGRAVDRQGDRLIIGAKYDNHPGVNTGSAYILERGAVGEWGQVAKVVSADVRVYDNFGAAVSLSGTAALITAPGADPSGRTSAGAAYVFERDAKGAWKQVAKLTAKTLRSSDWFGSTGVIDGSRLVVGANGDDTKATNAGKVYVFERQTGGKWSLAAELIAADGGAFDELAWRGLDLQGGRVLAGASLHNGKGPNAGAAYVWERQQDGTFKQTAKLQAADGAADDRFGAAVALSGERALIGANFDGDGGSKAGTAFVFERSTKGTWQQLAKLKAGHAAAFDYFGAAVELVGDVAYVGATGDDDRGASSGAVYTFVRSLSGKWVQSGKIVSPFVATGQSLGWQLGGDAGGLATGIHGHDGGRGAVVPIEVSITRLCTTSGTCSCKPGYTGAKCGTQK